MSRVSIRGLRVGIFAALIIFLIYHLSTRGEVSSYVPGRSEVQKVKEPASENAEKPIMPKLDNSANDDGNQPLELDTSRLPSSFSSSSSLSSSSSTSPSDEAPYERANATFVTLARNEDLWDIVGSIRQVEDRFNHQFHYDWVFLNDKPFNENFKTVTSRLVSGRAKYGLIPNEHWGYPDWIDQEKAAKARQDMADKKIIYGGSESYRHMCRFESGFFWRSPDLVEYKYYWRVEPSIKLHCNIDYDVFKFMIERKLKYGFTISLYEYIETIPTLWESTRKFIDMHPEYLAPDNLMDFISDDNGETYNKCHFWSNFEVVDLDFWRSKPYQEYFDFLDREGGFFYERWGDAPVHSIGASLFLNKDEVHFFEDIGYYHVPFSSCPSEDDVRYKEKCICDPKTSFTWKGYSCTPKFYKAKHMVRPVGWSEGA